MTLQIDGMSCGRCVDHVTGALTALPGVRVDEVRVGSARVTLDKSQANPSDLLAAVAEAGYEARLVPGASERMGMSGAHRQSN